MTKPVKNTEENLFITIVKEIRNSLDIDTTKQKIVEIIGRTLNADRCFIMDYDKANDTFSIVKDEYISSDDIPRYAGANVNEDVPNFMEEFKKGNYLVVDNKKIFINNEPQEYDTEKDTIEKVQVNSAYGFPFFYDNELHGALGIHYISEKHKVSQDEIRLLLSIAEQIAIAIYHAKLYKKIKAQAKRENLIKNIIEKIRSSLDIDETLSFICEETAKLFNVQRVTISMVPDIKKLEEFTIRKEYKLDSEINGISSFADVHKIFSYWADKLIKDNQIIAIDNVKESDMPVYFKNSYWDAGIKSLIGSSIRKGNEIWGTLVLSEYNEYRQWSEEDKNLLSTIANQTFIAINQAELFESKKIAFEREKILRQIIETVRSTFDIVEVKQKVITAIAEALNGNRCYIVEFNENTGKYFPISQEYLAPTGIRSIIGYDVEKNIPELVDFIKGKPLVLIPDINKFVEENNFSDAVKNYFETYDIKSRVYVKISHMENFFGTLVVNFPKKREFFKDEDIDFIETLANQVGITMYQAKLYNFSQLQVAREKILGTILTKSISTFDITQIKPIVREVGIMAKADRCYFVEAKEEGLSGKQIYYDGEYLASPDVKSAIGYTFPTEDVHKFVEMYLEVKDLIVFDYEEILKNTDEQFSGMRKYIKRFDLKSAIGIPLFYKGKLHAVLAIEYAKEKVLPTEDELNFYRLLGQQAGMVLNQIKLFQNQKLLIANQNAILNNMPFIAWLKNTDLIYEAANEPFAKLCRCTVEDLIGKNDYEIFPKEMAETYQSEDKIVMEKRITLPIEEIINMNEVNAWYEVFKSPVIDDNGNVIGTAGLARDISERKQAEAELLLKQEKIAKASERESLLREISSAVSSTLDINEIIHTFVFEIGKIINAQKVFFSFYEESSNAFLTPIEYFEYRESPEILKYSDMARVLDDNFPAFCEYIKTSKEIMYIPDVRVFLKDKGLEDGIDTISTRKYNFNSAIAFPVVSQDKLIGFYGIEYTNATGLTQENIDFLTTLSKQTFIAMNQADLYKTTKVLAEREALLRRITETIRSTLNLNELFELICSELANVFNVQRAFIVEFKSQDNHNEINIKKEIRTRPEIRGLLDNEFDIRTIEYWGDVLLNKGEKIIIDNIPESDAPDYFKKTYKNIGEKSTMGIAVKKGDDTWGWVGVAEYNYYRHWAEEDVTLLETISNQIYIAIKQAELYEITRKQAEREMLLRNITEKIRSTLDIEETKKSIVDIVGKTLNADRCLIIEYDKNSDKFLIVTDEYLSSNKILSYTGLNVNKEIPHFAEAIKSGHNLFVDNKEIFLDTDNQDFDAEKKIIEKYEINSAYTFPLYYHDELLGTLSIHYVTERHHIGADEIDFINLIANQVAIAIYQARLYKKIQLQAERERISRSIIEILRSTLDKKIIKNLFVKSIGKYFSADRVFFSEFDSKSNKNLPVDSRSEFLSSPDEKSFVNYDLSGPITGGHIQPLVEKRELIIPNWNEYVKKTSKTPEFISLYADANIKSSYGFPVLYEGRKMGYFCIDFTHKIVELWDEDINRIRSICTQAGIALYHAELYLTAQEALQSKGDIIARVKGKIEGPVENIIKTSKVLSELELEHDKQLEYLNNIIESCNQLLELTKEINDSDNI